MTLETGSVLNNRYRMVKQLGKGGFGAVYRAWDTSLEKPCAIKENLGTTDEAQRQFRREATILANVVHPNLPRVTDHFIIPGQGQYLVMDYVEGEDLQSMLEHTGGPLPTQQVLSWLGQVCDALSYLHSQNPPIIHRDVKPANIRITPGGQAMLVDFGIAKIFDPHMKTTTGARAVTPGFSPPEQYGQGTTDARSDIYALGATIYALLTNQIPPDSVNLISGGAAPRPTQELNRQVPAYVSNAITRAMQVNRTARFDNAREFKAALLGFKADAQQYVTPLRAVGSVAAGQVPVAPTVLAPTPSTSGPYNAIPSFQSPATPRTGPRRSPWIFIAGGLVGLVVLGIVCSAVFGALSSIFSSPTHTPASSDLVDVPIIQNAYMALDQAGEEPTSVFTPEDDFYAIVEVADGQNEATLKSSWIAKDARGMAPDSVFFEYEMQVTEGKHWMRNSKVEGSRGAGSYLVEIYLNDELKQTLVFEVRSDGPYTENLITAFDQEGTRPTTVFGSNDVFYVIGNLVNAPQEVSLKVVWTAVDVEGEKPNAQIGEYELSMDAGGFWFSLSPENPPWNTGTYRVEMFIKDEVVDYLEFEVR
jgi:serine/threonine protein kinase